MMSGFLFKLPLVSVLIFSALWSFANNAGTFVLRDSGGNAVRYAGKYSSRKIVIAKTAPRRGEFRGIWVATVENLDFKSSRSVAEFKANYIRMVDRIAKNRFNAIIFQVRPNCDAFYPSRFAPYSQFLSGVEGRPLGAGFDPLKFMINEAHRRNLEFHAWLNPYRVVNESKVSKKAYLNSRHAKNFARQNPHLVLRFKNGQLFLDPGQREVVRHVVNVVNEIATNYNVDGIHIDDYFYPYEEIGSLDDVTYRTNNPRRLSKANWRRANTELLVCSISRTIRNVNLKQRKKIRFGVSPFGIWGNKKDHSAGSLTGGKQTYFNLYADTRRWVKMRYVDYIVPQLYWNFRHDTAAYAALVDWWSHVVRDTGVRLYIGQGAYRAGAWDKNELVNQLRYNRMHPEVSGTVLFSYRHIFGEKIHPECSRFLRFLSTNGR